MVLPACLVGIAGSVRSRIFPLDEHAGSERTLGRVADAWLRVPDESIGRRHARFCVTATGHAVKDLGSSNGTRVDGVRVENATLIDGCELRFGMVLMRYLRGEDSADRASQVIAELDRIEPVTRLARTWSGNAAVVTVARWDQLVERHGGIVLELALTELARRMVHACAPDETVSYIQHGTFAITPAQGAAALVTAVHSDLVIDSEPLALELVVCPPLADRTEPAPR